MADEDEDELLVRWLVATPDDAASLLRASLDLVQERQLDGLHVAVPAVDWMEEALGSNGFEIHSTHLYEKPL